MASVLLVEGHGDVSFFRSLLVEIGYKSDEITVSPPETYGLQNTVSVFPELVREVIEQMDTGSIAKLGIVVDADHVSGGGVEARWDRFRTVLQEYHYNVPRNLPKKKSLGSIFKNRDGLPPVGFWLLPDHGSNGMLEDLVKRTITEEKEQQSLIQYAESVEEGIPTRLFSEYHRTKAVVYPWLAWQRRPGTGLSMVFVQKLVDKEKQPLKGLIEWLHLVFGGR